MITLLESVFTWNFIPGWNHPCLWWECLLLFTRFCRDEISSRNELISVKKTGMKFHLGRRKRCVNTSTRDEILKWVFFFFFIFDVCIQICFLELTCFNIMKVWIQWNIRIRITSKKSKMSKHFYYFFYFLWEVYKRLKFHFALIFFLQVTYIVLTARN